MRRYPPRLRAHVGASFAARAVSYFRLTPPLSSSLPRTAAVAGYEVCEIIPTAACLGRCSTVTCGESCAEFCTDYKSSSQPCAVAVNFFLVKKGGSSTTVPAAPADIATACATASAACLTACAPAAVCEGGGEVNANCSGDTHLSARLFASRMSPFCLTHAPHGCPPPHTRERASLLYLGC